MAAINKRKLLESAQRHLQKGAVDKALADYQTVLQADPRDTNVRLKVGDLLQKAGRNEDAIAAYLKVADQFQRDGFDAKAVALYKQVTKIDGKRHDVYVPLADLYQRLGLVSEAMSALQTAAEAYQRDGRKREALDLLRRMASLDPANVTSRLKVAELLKQEGLVEEAVAEFREAAAELERQGDWEARAGVLERVVELQPEGVEDLEGLATIWLERGQPRRAHAAAQKLVEADPTRPESHEILARVLADLGQEELAIDAFRQCAEAWRVRGEEGRAREIVQRYLPTQDFESLATSLPEATATQGTAAAAELFGSAGELGAEPAAGEGVFGSEPIEVGGERVIELGGDAPAFQGDLPELGRARQEPAPAPAAEPAPAAATPPPPPRPAAAAASDPTPDGDVEQLLAEAAVYGRYGKHERALACLEAALAQDPAHGGALEQLGEAQLAVGAPERAVEAWTRAAELASEASDAARFAVLRARIETLDPAAAATLPAPVSAGAPASGAPFAGDEPEAAGDPVAEDEALAADAGPAADRDELDDIEIDVDDVSFEEEADEAAAPAAEAGDEGAVDLDLELEDEDEGAPAREPAPDAAALEIEAAPEPALEAAPPDDDEEIVFDGEDAAAAEPAVEEPPAPAPERWELPEDDEALAATEPPDAVRAAPAEAPVAAVAAGDPHAVTPAPDDLSTSAAAQIQEDLEEAGFYFDQGLFAEAEAVYRRILARAPSHPGALLRLGEIAVQRGTPIVETPPTPAAVAASAPVREEPPEIEPPDALDLTAPTLDDAAQAAWSGEVAPLAEADDSTAGVTADLAGESFDDTTLRPGAEAPSAMPPPPAAAAAAAPPVPTPAAVAPAEDDAHAVVDEPELTTPDLAPDAPSFDLAAELSEALSDTGSGTTGRGTDEEGFASLFRDFKRGVSQTLGEGDVETHFDLGIAYREMGLFEDAIGEFRYALGSPARRLDALQLMGLCAIDLGRGHDAVGHLEQALASPEVPAEREAPLRYELGRAYLVLPDAERALDAFRRAHALDPGYQDVAERIAELENADDTPEAPAEPEPAPEAFESFDDLVAEAAEDAPPAPPSYESFDDVVAEANDDDDDDDDGDGDDEPDDAPPADLALEDATEAALAGATVDDDDTASSAAPAAVAAEPEPQPEESATPAQRRRRKVSFV